MTRILAIDLGKFKSVACLYTTESSDPVFQTVQTRPQVFHDLIAEQDPHRVVIEVGSAAGWVKDLCEAMEIAIEVANPNHEAWRWKSVKRKTDKDDALKLAKLSAMGQLPTVQLPTSEVRQWRSLISYRTTLVRRRTAIKNSIRAIIDHQGMKYLSGRNGWTKAALAQLHQWSSPLVECEPSQLWRGQLYLELTALDQIQSLISIAEKKLDTIAASSKSVKRLQTVPGVGPRLAEWVVAVIDNPQRFRNGKQVGAYIGLCPRQYESGQMSRSGGITGQGHRLLRSLLVEVSWLTLRYNPWLASVYNHVCRGSKTRRKIAVVAVARRLIILCWAMLRDGTDWREPVVT